MAPPITNYVEIQQDEIEVLRSIYMEAFEEEKARVGAWKVSRIHVLVLQLYTSSTDAQAERAALLCTNAESSFSY